MELDDLDVQIVYRLPWIFVQYTKIVRDAEEPARSNLGEKLTWWAKLGCLVGRQIVDKKTIDKTGHMWYCISISRGKTRYLVRI